MKKFIGLSAILMVMAFVGDVFAAKKSMGTFVVPNGKSAYEVWKEISGNENKTLTDFFNSLTMKPKKVFESCSALSTAGMVEGDMVYVKDQSGDRLCIFNGTSFPSCPNGCGLATAVQGESGHDGCSPDLTISEPDSTTGCYTVTLTSKEPNGSGVCQPKSGGTTQKTLCGPAGQNGTDSCTIPSSEYDNTSKCLLSYTTSGTVVNGVCVAIAGATRVLTGKNCTQCEAVEYYGSLDADTRCKTKYIQNRTRDLETGECVNGALETTTECEPCPEKTRRKPSSSPDGNGCYTIQVGTGVNNGSGCTYAWADTEKKECPACEAKVTYTTREPSTGCKKKQVQNQRLNLMTHLCENDGVVSETYECDPCTMKRKKPNSNPDNKGCYPAQIGTAVNTGNGCPTAESAYTWTDSATETICECSHQIVTEQCAPDKTTKCDVVAKSGIKVSVKDCMGNAVSGMNDVYVYTGEQGPTGDTPIISVTEKVTVVSDDQAAVTVDNSNPVAPKLTFSLPKGEKGDPVCSGSFTIEEADVQDQSGKTKYTLFCTE